MFDEVDAIAFEIWCVDTGNGSRADWLQYDEKDKYERMARAAILRMRVLKLV